MHYRVTVRYGGSRQRYHTYTVDAPDARTALTAAADHMPDDVAPEADLVELRVAVDPEERTYVGDEGP